jgi:tetratricopeptide (TPR) repeat protein
MTDRARACRSALSHLLLSVALVTLAFAGCAQPADQGAPGAAAPDSPADVLGEVSFLTTCDPAVQADFDAAVATLHSFEYDEARAQFASVAERDPDCAMAHWGVAMTFFHPLWQPPTPAELEAGSAAIEAAAGLEASARERQYVEALAAFYRDADAAPHAERSRRWEQAMAGVREQNPDDVEATIFYGLSRLANLDLTDKTYTVQKETGAMLEPLFAEMPSHPGLAHYIIHSYDFPPLAERAEEAAHRYLDIAASMPHALHMSGHIFTQLGMWEEAIEANARSAAAARERASRQGMGGQAQMNEMHALDYQLYAHLQRGEMEEGRAILDHVLAQESLNWQNGIIAFNAGAVPVRWAMERGAWEEAAALPELTGAEHSHGPYPVRGAVALRHWARAVGAARSGKLDQADAALAKLTALAEELKSSEDVWARNTSEVLRRQAAGWLSHARGDQEDALELIRSAAELEDQTDKSGLSPGRVLPAREQLGDLLLLLDRPAEALAEYEASLKQAPRRFHSHLFAARAAKAAGDHGAARAHYQSLQELLVADSTLPERAEAVEFLSETS